MNLFMGNFYSIAVGAAVHGVMIYILCKFTDLPTRDILQFCCFMSVLMHVGIFAIILVIATHPNHAIVVHQFEPQSGKEFAISKHMSREKRVAKEKRRALQLCVQNNPNCLLN